MNDDLSSVYVNYAIVAFGPISDFLDVMRFVQQRLGRSKLIYCKKSLGRLRIVEEVKEHEEKRKR